MPSIEDMPRGVDVSGWQSAVNWPAVAASGIAFAWCKATESTNYLDPFFTRNWAQIREHGMVRGAYHFAQPGVNAPEAEAEWFIGHVMGQGIETGDLLALDLEAGSGDLSDWALRFVRHAELLAGFRPMVYTSPAHIAEYHLANRPELGEYGLWLASWRATLPPAPEPWPFVACWQYTDSESVPGVNGGVDGDRFNLAAERIPLYGKPSAPEPEPEPPLPPPDPSPTLAAWKAEGLALLDGEERAFRDMLRAWIARMPVPA